MDSIYQELCPHIKCIATPLSSLLNFCHVIQPHFNVYLLLRVFFRNTGNGNQEPRWAAL